MTVTLTFIAPGIECAGCAASIQKTLSRRPGIESVSVDVPAKAVTVQGQDGSVSREQIAEALTEIGFPPEPLEST